MYNPKSLKERLVKGSVITLTLALIGSVLAYLVRILLSRTLTVENYGLYYAIFGLISVVTAYVDLGFGYAVVYLFPKHIKDKNYSKAWNVFIYGQAISITTSIIASIFFIAFAPFLAQKYFKLPGSEILIYIFCVYLISFTVINGLIQVFTGFQKEKYYSSIAVFRWLLTLVFSFSFLFFGFSNIFYYAIALCMGHVLTALIFL
ncbi:MAG: oligosaccharide flippase family protein, partial [Candidatus Daviesbacteria bacterium]|nr:oligosaccharide flippase family protein [Candidatus Daviesbacteria bacterium]